MLVQQEEQLLVIEAHVGADIMAQIASIWGSIADDDALHGWGILSEHGIWTARCISSRLVQHPRNGTFNA